MDYIHISGTPGSGKTSMCLVVSKNILLEGGRVFWLSTDINSDRFSQIMEDLPISNASKFHSLLFSEDMSSNNGFEQAINQLIIMPSQLPSTRIIVIDGWDQGMELSSKKLRLDKINELIEVCKRFGIKLYITSQSYENASGTDKKHTIRSKGKLEKIGFENWLIFPDDDSEALRILNKPNEQLSFKMSREGIEYTV